MSPTCDYCNENRPPGARSGKWAPETWNPSVRFFVDVPLWVYFRIAVPVGGRVPMHAPARIPVLRAGLFGMKIPVSRLAAMQISDTDACRHYAPSPNEEHNVA